MQTTSFWLHYPDGRVEKQIRDDLAPDAFLLQTVNDKAYWVSFKVSSMLLTFKEAETYVAYIKIRNTSCNLPTFFCLWSFMKKFEEINKLCAQLRIPLFPRTKYWANKLPRVNFAHGHYFTNAKEIKRFECKGDKKEALALPVIEARYPREIISRVLSQNNRSQQAARMQMR